MPIKSQLKTVTVSSPLAIPCSLQMNNLQKHYQQINELKGRPELLIHICCGVCSVYPLQYLRQYFRITIFFSNSNIYPFEEFERRLDALRSYLDYLDDPEIKLIVDGYDNEGYTKKLSQYKDEPEGGKRCKKCFEFRLKHSHQIAIDYIKQNDLSSDKNYLSTTLTVSPHKNSTLINSIGEEICSNSIIDFLPSDYKKEDGYYNSIILSKKNHLYRQKYCGCEFSK